MKIIHPIKNPINHSIDHSIKDPFQVRFKDRFNRPIKKRCSAASGYRCARAAKKVLRNYNRGPFLALQKDYRPITTHGSQAIRLRFLKRAVGRSAFSVRNGAAMLRPMEAKTNRRSSPNDRLVPNDKLSPNRLVPNDKLSPKDAALTDGQGSYPWTTALSPHWTRQA